jgi:hypothetical protein
MGRGDAHTGLDRVPAAPDCNPEAVGALIRPKTRPMAVRRREGRAADFSQHKRCTWTERDVCTTAAATDRRSSGRRETERRRRRAGNIARAARDIGRREVKETDHGNRAAPSWAARSDRWQSCRTNGEPLHGETVRDKRTGAVGGERGRQDWTVGGEIGVLPGITLPRWRRVVLVIILPESKLNARQCRTSCAISISI